MASPLRAADLTNGLMVAVPSPGGKAPALDGKLTDWDLSAAEPLWITPETAALYHASFALMYDADALYVGARIHLPGRPLRNPNTPADAFWQGDLLQFHLVSDPALPWPAAPDSPAVQRSDRVVHAALWKNTQTGADYLHLAYGVNSDQGQAVNPPGSQVVIRQEREEYVVEARIPWSALHAPNGKNPFVPGRKMTAIVEVLWAEGDSTRTAAVYRENPGFAAVRNADKWGQVTFSATGNLKPRHGTMEDALKAASPPPIGVPIEITLPAPGKLSVNILGPDGEVLRELVGGEPHPKGKTTVYWDGRDQWGVPLSAGVYRWGAYLSPGLRAEYMGRVGASGNSLDAPEDGKGSWGANYGSAIDVAADKTGLYFLWTSAEQGSAVIKTDYAGNVLWRKTPSGGGFGLCYAIAANGQYVFLTFGMDKPQLLRLDATTGQRRPLQVGKEMGTWGDGEMGGWGGAGMVSISESTAIRVPAESSLVGAQPESVGLACNEKEVFASVYGRDLIRVFDAETGALLREFACPGPRGLALDRLNDLCAVSYTPDRPPQILKFFGGRGIPQAILQHGLAAPWDVAVDAMMRVHVTDLGSSQQVKTFTQDDKLARASGKAGGRTWAGAYDGGSFLLPAGIATDAQGGLLVAEASPPKVMSRFDAASGKLLQRWFAPAAPSAMTFPDPDDPRALYTVLEPEGVGRWALDVGKEAEGVQVFRYSGIQDTPNPANKPNTQTPKHLNTRIPEHPTPNTQHPTPNAYWVLPRAGFPEVGTLAERIAAPVIIRGVNGKKYLVSDTSPHGICLVEGDTLLPVGYARVTNGPNEKPMLEIWSDLNGDHHPQPNEIIVIRRVGGREIVRLADTTGSLWMAPNGDLYFTTQANAILRVPAASMEKNGLVRWDTGRASYVVPAVLARLGKPEMPTSWRTGLLGVRTDSKGNLYTCFNTQVEYATKELTARMREGLGHTAESNAVKFAKFAPNGKLLWMVGRKATAAAKPGEIYHFWVMAGLVGDRYVAGASEWGPITFYTEDGFFVDSLMNNPGFAPPPGPYTFGGETFGGRVQFFPKQEEVWAYSGGRAFRVEGFKQGRVEGERRLYGSVPLTGIYEQVAQSEDNAPLQIVPMRNPFANERARNAKDPNYPTTQLPNYPTPNTQHPTPNAYPVNEKVWNAVPQRALRRNNASLATVQLGYDGEFLYARLHVMDETPLQNGADDSDLAFHGGDGVGLLLGPAGKREQPVLGDVRLLAANIGGRPRLIAMKPFTNARIKRPERYATPGGREQRFAFVGEVPGGQVTLVADADGKGYTAVFAVPRRFLEIPLRPGVPLAADVEVLLSGQSAHGLQTTARHYLFTPSRPETTPTDDLPTEAALSPQYWGVAEVK